jgi:hypothetical protein
MVRSCGLRARLSLLFSGFVLALTLCGVAGAATVTAFGFDSTYRAVVLPDRSQPTPDGWTEVGFDDSSWQLLQAPFGNNDDQGCGFPTAVTDWPAYGRVLARKTFTLPLGAHGLHLHGTIDNHAHVYVNGHQVTEVDDGNCQKDGIDVDVPDAYLNPGGDNVVSTMADDWGWQTFFDLEATYESVPAPAVTPTVTGTQGTNGWYTSDVTVSWAVSDPGATTTGCDTTAVTTDTTGTTFTCTASNAGGSDTESVTVERDATKPVLAPSVATALQQGSAATASAGATDATSGVASSSCDTVGTSALGPETITCTATDAAGNSATASTSTVVYADGPGDGGNGGAFVLGDRTAKGFVTFWGAQWASLNALSGGSAPSAFKGYAAVAGGCGSAWTTGPGNSANPPAGPLPAYIAVIVTTKATKTASQIGGTVAHIVVVKTNAGYAADPGHAGTGTVVATVC